MNKTLARRCLERGRQFELQGEAERAAEAYLKACELDEDLAEAHFLLGQLEAGRGNAEVALDWIEKAVASEPDPEYREWRAYLYGRLRRYEEALADYQALFEGGEPLIRVNAGRMLLALRRYDEAEQVLEEASHESAEPLLRAIPRYREFGRNEPADDVRAVRYLFGGTAILGTRSDGGVQVSYFRYLLLSPAHVATTLERLCALVERRGWSFDAVAGEGPRHRPVAVAVGTRLGLPVRDTPERGLIQSRPAADGGPRILLCSSVVSGRDERRRLEAPWRRSGARLLHFAVGLAGDEEPTPDEPELVGISCPTAVWWYRVAPFARLEADPGVKDGPWPGFGVGPPHIDPNVERTSRTLLDACRQVDDPHRDAVLGYFERHAQLRAFDWEGSS